MLEWMSESTQGSDARALRGESMAPGGESVIGRRRLIPIRTIGRRSSRGEASPTDLDMLSAAVAPTMLENDRPSAGVAASVAMAKGQHAFAFSFREVAHMRTARLGPRRGGGYCSIETLVPGERLLIAGRQRTVRRIGTRVLGRRTFFAKVFVCIACCYSAPARSAG